MAQSKSTAKKNTKTSKKTTTKRSAPAAANQAPPIRREIWGGIFLCLAVFMGISYFNTDGAFIKYFSDLLKGLIGWGFWLIAPVFLLVAVILFFHRGRPVGWRVFSALMLPILLAAMAELTMGELPGEFDLMGSVQQYFAMGMTMESGGVIGGLIATGLREAFSVYGAMPLLIVVFIVFLVIALRGGFKGLFSGVKLPEHRDYDPADYPEPAPLAQPKTEKTQTLPPQEPKKTTRTSRPAIVDIPLGDDEEPLSLSGPSAHEDEYSAEPKKQRTRVRKRPAEEPLTKTTAPKMETLRIDRTEDLFADSSDETLFKELTEKPIAPVTPTPVKPAPKAPEKPAPVAVKPVTVTAAINEPPKVDKIRREEVEQEAEALEKRIASSNTPVDYVFPPVELLRSSNAVTVDGRDEIRINQERLESAMRSFGINAAVVAVTRGPSVTRYDIELEQGVKLSRITNLAGDLALALGVENVRIAPITDKISTVGIEVPNKIVSPVFLRDVIDSPKFANAESKLSFSLGKDISGECIVGNIAKLPHLLIAGTTGSGKSVCMNSLILSLLYKARPDEVRLIMIDPKMVELGIYNGIPHLYVPVVTDPKKAAGALQWSVVEMLKRYRAFSEVGVRDLGNYNKHCQANGEPTLPRVVIVIDELADLMMVASKEVEESICRVAQMGRAAGMHLVIATQRPSADVITGLMKANIPSRIAFAVSSAMESRIILDQGGAEKLIGMGDMLFAPVGGGKPTRIQGSFVSDEEREDVINFIKEHAGGMEQNADLTKMMEEAGKDKGASDNGKNSREEEAAASGYDEMLPQAVEAVLEAGSCSVSMLQRRVKLGYSRAARIVDQMEELGVVGPYEGAKPRSVVIDRAGWHDLQVSLGLISDDELSLAAEMSEAADSEEN